MTTSGQKFQASLGKWANITASRLEALARQAIQETCEMVVAATPVDTGFLRGNWQPSIGAPEPFKPLHPGDTVQPPKAVSLVVKNLRAGDTFYMTNNTAYARFVEYGTSRMAGRFFMTRAIRAWPQTVERAAVKLGL